MHESILPDTPVTDYCDHDIRSSSRVHICQCPTLKLYYKNRLLNVIYIRYWRHSFSQSPDIPILLATQQAIQADGQSYLPIIREINIYLNCEEIPLLHLTALVISKLGCEILAGMLFIMSNQIIINTLKSVITINNKYDVNFSSLGRSTAFLCQLTEFYFLEIPFKYQYPRILLIIQNFQLSLISNSQKTVQNHQLSKMTNQHLHYLIP